MIRFRRLTPRLLEAWLVSLPVASTHHHYRLRVWRENREGFKGIRDELNNYVEEAFEDARIRIRRGFEDDLSPFRDPPADPAANYPALLHRVTLQGYFGETLAALAIEHWGAHGHEDWVVPAFLFRLHDQEFQHLDSINARLAGGEAFEPDHDAELRPGRTGDDGLAFRINDKNTITDILVLEAKCLARNNTAKIKEAHVKLAAGLALPSGVRELVSILAEYNTQQAQAWQQALLNLWLSGARNATRQDCVGYACGQIPVQRRRLSWMDPATPHPAYTAVRNLECLEFHFGDLDTLIDTLYRGALNGE
jgi:hypothetical protein